MADPARLIAIGKILAPFGVKGWVKVEPYTESPESFQRFKEWRIGRGEPGPGWKQVKVAESRTHSGTVVARLAGCEDRDAALEYSGLEAAVPRSELPKPKKGEVYQADMIGLEVRNKENEVLGKVAGLFSNGAHEVLRIAKDDGSEQLIPMVPAVLDKIDLDAGTVRVDWGSDW